MAASGRHWCLEADVYVKCQYRVFSVTRTGPSAPYLKVSDDALQVVVPLQGAQVDLVPALLQRASLAGDVVLGAAALLLGALGSSEGVLGGGAGTVTS